MSARANGRGASGCRAAAALGSTIAVTLLAGCKVSTEPLESLTATGTVTAGGEPAPALIELSAGNFQTIITFPDGNYSITVGGGAIPSSACASAAIRAGLLDEDEVTVLDEQTRQLGSCGQHEVDFEFP